MLRSIRLVAPASVAGVGFIVQHNWKSQACCASREPSSSRRCIIVGSGIVGLTTAYYLKRTGAYEEIHVIDKEDSSCLGCSFQNGGVINTEAIAPVNSYMSIFGTMKQSLLHMLTGVETNTLITWRALLEPPGILLRWLWYFWQNADAESILRNSFHMLHLGEVTGPLFEEAFAHLGFSCEGHNFLSTPGLVLFHSSDPHSTIAAKHAKFGCVKRKLYLTDGELEQVLKNSNLLGLESYGFNVGCVEPNNYTVNTRRFGDSLQRYLQDQGVTFHFSNTVKRILVTPTGNAVSAVELNDGRQLDATNFVFCAGYETCYLMRTLGISLPLAPVKAYSLHISNCSVAPDLKYATHVEGKVAALITPYRDTDPKSVRVTGIRDLDGFNDILRPERLAALLDCAKTFIGSDFDVEKDVAAWTGVMGVSPDDFPVVGKLKKFENAFVNTGHGFRGTNWSVASAKLLSQIITGDCDTILDPGSFAPSRFGV